MFKRNKKYNMNKKAANDTLQNVFAACEVEPNETPLEVIRVWNIANAAIVKVGFWVSIALLVVVLLMPVAFKESRHSNGNKVNSVNVSVVGHYLDKENGQFVMTLSGNGVLYDEIYAKKDDGSIIKPSKIEEEYNMVYIPFEDGNINIYIPKSDGTVLQAVLSK